MRYTRLSKDKPFPTVTGVVVKNYLYFPVPFADPVLWEGSAA